MALSASLCRCFEWFSATDNSGKYRQDVMGRIRICDLLVRCILGINENERHEKQDVLISLTIHTNLHKAGKSDLIDDTVDYRALKKTRLLNGGWLPIFSGRSAGGSHYRIVPRSVRSEAGFQ